MIGLSQKHIEAIRQQWDGDLYPCNAEFYALCDLALLGLRAAGYCPRCKGTGTYSMAEIGSGNICPACNGSGAAPPASAPEPVAEGEVRWLIERTYAKGQPAERREFWLGVVEGDVHTDSFSVNEEVWTTNAIEAARYSSKKIAQQLSYRHFHPEAPVDVCDHRFQCGIQPATAHGERLGEKLRVELVKLTARDEGFAQGIERAAKYAEEEWEVRGEIVKGIRALAKEGGR